MLTSICGINWGDEGKGRMVDLLSEKFDVVCRYQGGNNAGHTVEIGDKRYVLHLVPSGIFRPEVTCVIGNGLVVDPVALDEELRGIEEKGFSTANVQLSNRAQMIFIYHRIADTLSEDRAKQKIGTTGRGIGPAYMDKMRRSGIRAIDLKFPEKLAEQFRTECARYNKIFASYGVPELNVEEAAPETEEKLEAETEAN